MPANFIKLRGPATRKIARSRLLLGVLAVPFCILSASAAQTAAPTAAATPPTGAALYRSLRDVDLDPSRIYKVRDLSVDLEDIHLTLRDGKIAFLKAVDGHVTGAMFAGDGDLLIMPPSQGERSSLALFTNAAQLDVTFRWAFFRFEDEAVLAAHNALRPLDDPEEDSKEFLQQWSEPARALEQNDALALAAHLVSEHAEVSASPGVSASKDQQPSTERTRTNFLHLLIGATNLGTLDVLLDTRRAEQIAVGRIDDLNKDSHYDLMLSFPMRSARESTDAISVPLQIPAFEIHTEVKPPTQIEGEAILTLRSHRPNVRAIFLELSRYLKVSDADLEGAPVEIVQNESLSGSELARRGNDSVALFLPRALPTDAPVRLHLRYAGAALVDAGNGLIYPGDRGTWYPHLEAMEMSRYDLTFTYPGQWNLVATGKPVSNESLGGGVSKSHWVSEGDVPFAGFSLGRFEKETANAAGVTITAYSAVNLEKPQGETTVRADAQGPNRRTAIFGVTTAPPALISGERLGQVSEEAARVVNSYSEKLGRLPFSSISLTPIPGTDSQGWPGLLYLSDLCFVPEKDLPGILERNYKGLAEDKDMGMILFSGMVEAHELAHQWWGDTVSWKSYHDQWISEGLANYMALMELEQRDPGAARRALEYYRHLLQRKNDGGRPVREAGPVTLGVRLDSTEFPLGYKVITYGRGTWLLHMLREMLRDASLHSLPANSTAGRSAAARRASAEADTQDKDKDKAEADALFWQTLKTLWTSHRGQQISTADLQKAFEETLPKSLWYEGHRSLDWFFDGWVNGTAMPKYELSGVKLTTLRSGVVLATGKLLQKDAPDTLVTSVPLYAATGGSKPVYAGRIFADGTETDFKLKVPAGTKKLVVDPNGTVLTEP